MKLLMNAKRNRKYPNISVGDKVRLYRKKDKLDKQHIGVWSHTLHTVEKIIEENGQKLSKIKGYDRPFLRSEILFIE
jgi:hypothetical protein